MGRVSLINEIVERDTKRFRVAELPPEVMDDNLQIEKRPGEKVVFRRRTILWIGVQNVNGPACHFSAQYGRVREVAHLGATEPLSITGLPHAMAWEDYATRTIEIGYHCDERLYVAECFKEPFCMWFLIPGTVAWGEPSRHARTPPVVPIDGKTVKFDLSVVNQSERKEMLLTGTVIFDDDHNIEAFTLGEREP